MNVNLRRADERHATDIKRIAEARVPLLITCYRAPAELVGRVHAYGGVVFHNLAVRRHAESAARAGVDGLILAAAGASGHAGTINPFALLEETRRWYDGTIILAGA